MIFKRPLRRIQEFPPAQRQQASMFDGSELDQEWMPTVRMLVAEFCYVPHQNAVDAEFVESFREPPLGM
jgi:hypothetical protein